MSNFLEAACAQWRWRGQGRVGELEPPRFTPGTPQSQTGQPVVRADALIFMVRLAGIEPTTPWFVAQDSLSLSRLTQAHSGTNPAQPGRTWHQCATTLWKDLFRWFVPSKSEAAFGTTLGSHRREPDLSGRPAHHRPGLVQQASANKNADQRRELYLDRAQYLKFIEVAPPNLAAFLRGLCQPPLRPGALANLCTPARRSATQPGSGWPAGCWVRRAATRLQSS
jgi:hypothetical protein